MKVRDLHQALLTHLQTSRDSTLPDAGEFQRLLTVLQSAGEKPLIDLCDVVEKGFASKRQKKSKSPVATNKAAVASYVQDLVSKKGDLASFRALLSRVRSDKNLKVADIKAIANAYRGVEASYKSKDQALDAIQNKFLADSRSPSKIRGLSDIF